VARRLVTIDQAGHLLGVSRSTVCRLIQRGDLASVRRTGRRMVSVTALRTQSRRRRSTQVAAFSDDHPIFRLVGARRGGGKTPDACDKHAILDE
jgi:excisionase family DNA binding protein